jgi:hypothetical protein
MKNLLFFIKHPLFSIKQRILFIWYWKINGRKTYEELKKHK